MSVDFNLQTMLRDSKGNGLFNKTRELKKQINNLQEQFENVMEELIDAVEAEGKIIAHVDGEPLPYVLTVKRSERSVLDKETLASDLGVSQSSLNTDGFVELANEQKVTPKMLQDYKYKETGRKLSARKAKKSDLEIIFSRGKQ
jgi:hypothetical protein